MIKFVLFALGLVALASAFPWDSPYHGYPYYYYGNPYYGGYWDPYYYPYHGTGKLIYYGEFHGTCKGAPDGLYYVDERSFAYCSNGVKTIQPCAEGSANPTLDHFQHGQYYGLLDFCSINLVAKGYNVAPAYPPKKSTEDPEPETYEKVQFKSVTYGDGSYEEREY